MLSLRRMLLLLLLPGLLLAERSGLAIVGGHGSGDSAETSAEFWAPAPGELPCSLPSLTRRMDDPTLDSWQDTVVACSWHSCDQLTPSGWQHWRNSLYSRKYHTSAVTLQGLLLVGGSESSTTTELLPWEGGESREGFTHSPRTRAGATAAPSRQASTPSFSLEESGPPPW